VLGRLEELEEDHQVLDASHREVETLVRRWLNQGRLGAEDAHRLNQRLGDMSAIYQRHIEVEETEVFPVARGSLDQSQLEMVGREMASRRGLDFDGLRSLDGSA
jgi:hemerythrin-like domain-containing protein